MPRPPREPLTPDELKQLEMMAGIGLTVSQMAAVLGTSAGTLKRRIKDNGSDPLKRGRGLALTNVGKTAYQLAVSGKCPAMTMFYLKCRGRWREKDRVEVTGKDGGPVAGQINVTIRRVGFDEKPKS